MVSMESMIGHHRFCTAVREIIDTITWRFFSQHQDPFAANKLNKLDSVVSSYPYSLKKNSFRFALALAIAMLNRHKLVSRSAQCSPYSFVAFSLSQVPFSRLYTPPATLRPEYTPKIHACFDFKSRLMIRLLEIWDVIATLVAACV